MLSNQWKFDPEPELSQVIIDEMDRWEAEAEWAYEDQMAGVPDPHYATDEFFI